MPSPLSPIAGGRGANPVRATLADLAQ
jgi:hypothetical protein